MKDKIIKDKIIKDILIKYRIIRDIRTLFEQERYCCKPIRVDNFGIISVNNITKIIS